MPRQFIPSVEKGVRAQMERGVASGYPMVDLRVTLTDGKAHSVDSSDMAFQTAGGLALRDAATRAGTCLLEPVDEVEVLVADDLVGTVMGDLSARRGKVLGSEQAEQPGLAVVRAEVPQLEMRRYAAELRSFSHGSASFTRAGSLATSPSRSRWPGGSPPTPGRSGRHGPGAADGAQQHPGCGPSPPESRVTTAPGGAAVGRVWSQDPGQPPAGDAVGHDGPRGAVDGDGGPLAAPDDGARIGGVEPLPPVAQPDPGPREADGGSAPGPGRLLVRPPPLLCQLPAPEPQAVDARRHRRAGRGCASR